MKHCGNVTGSMDTILSKGQSQLICSLVEPARGLQICYALGKMFAVFKVAPHLCVTIT